MMRRSSGRWGALTVRFAEHCLTSPRPQIVSAYTSQLAVAALILGFVMGCAPLLQLKRMIRTRSSTDLSLPYIGLILVGSVTWTLYGIAIDNPSVYISNAAGILTTSATIAIGLHYRKVARHTASLSPAADSA